MQIEKLSKYVVTASPTRSSSSDTTCRRMLLSLPRVRWLERDPDYVPFGSREEDLPPPPPPPASAPKPGQVLSGREDEIYNMRMKNVSFRDIAVHFGVSADTVRGMYARARRKKGEIL